MGGTGLYVQALAGALRAGGHDVMLLAPGPRGPLALLEAADHVQVQVPAPTRFEQTWRHRRMDALIVDWLRRWRPDVVHIHHLSGLSFGLITATRRLGVRVVLTLHDYALPCARGQLVDRSGRVCPGPRPARCARCLSEHLRLDPLSGAVGSLLARWPALRRRARQQVGALAPPAHAQARIHDRNQSVAAAMAAAHVLLSPSVDLADRIAALGLPRPTPHALPLIRPVPPAPPAPPGPVRFLFASSIIPTKGPHLLLEAFARLPRGAAQLSIVGPMPAFHGQPDYGKQLRERADQIPQAAVHPPVSASVIPDLLAAHDVLVLPSLWPENSPLIVREAAAAGLPLIVSDVGGAAELAPAARCVRPGDVDGLTQALMHEVEAGRRRLPPARWPRPQEHGERLVIEVYRSKDAGQESLG